MILLGTALHLALPPLSILAMGRLAPRRGLVWTVVAGLALYESLLLFFGLLLGTLGLLRAPGPLVLWTFVAAVLFALAVGALRHTLRAARTAVAGVRPRPVDVVIGLATLVTAYLVALQVGRDWIAGTGDFDSLVYHVPRALLWAWNGDFSPWPAPHWQQVGLPVGGDVLLLPGIFLGIGWIGGTWTTTWLSLGGAAAVFAATRSLGAGRRPSFVAALAFLSFPAVGLRLVDVSTDVAAAFPLLAAWVLATRARSMAEATFLFPALCGVGVASKANVVFAAAVLAIAFFGSRIRSLLDGRSLALAAAGTVLAGLLCVGSYEPVYRLFGDLVGGGEGWNLVSYRHGPAAVARSALYGALHWLVEPFALVPEPPRFDLMDRIGIDRAYEALDLKGARTFCYPMFESSTVQSGVLPFLAFPWLVAALPRGRRLYGSLLVLAILVSLFGPINPNQFASRFTIVLLGAFAVLWGMRAARSPWLVSVLVLASLLVDGDELKWKVLPVRPAPENARIAATVGSHTLWLLRGSLATDALIAGRRAEVQFRYLSCSPDGDWVQSFTKIRAVSPWLLLNSNSEGFNTGPGYPSKLFPTCRQTLVSELQPALTTAGWRLVLEENGYQVWSAEPVRTDETRTSTGSLLRRTGRSGDPAHR